MGWSVLQSVGQPNAGAASTITAQYTSNVSAGTKLICYAATDSGGNSITSVKDNNNNAFTEIVSELGGGSNGSISIWVLDTPAGDVGTKPTITVTTSAAHPTCIIHEVSGLVAGSTSAILDGSAGVSNGTASGTIGPPSYASSSSGEFLVYIYGDNGPGSGTVTVPSGYTADANNQQGSGNSDTDVAYKNSTGGTETGTYNTTTASSWALILVAFQVAPSVTPSVPVLIPPGRSSPQAFRFFPQPVAVPAMAAAVNVTATLAGTGSATAIATIGVSAGLNGSGSAGAVPDIVVAGSLAGSGSAGSGVAIGAGSTLAGAGSAAETTGVTISVTATLAGSGGATAVPAISVAAGLNGSGSATAVGNDVIQVTASLNGTGSAGAVPTIGVAGTLAGSGSAGAVPTIGIAGTLAGSGSAGSGVIISVSAGLNGSGGVTAVPKIVVGSGLAGSGSAGSGASGGTLSGTLAGAGSVTAIATIGVAGSLNGSGGATAVPAIVVAGSLGGTGSAGSGVTIGVTALLGGSGSASAGAVIGVAGSLNGSGSAGSGSVIGVAAVLGGSGGAAAIPKIVVGGGLAGSGGASARVTSQTVQVTARLAGAGRAFENFYTVDISIFVSPTLLVLSVGASTGMGRATGSSVNDGWGTGASQGVLSAGASIPQRGR